MTCTLLGSLLNRLMSVFLVNGGVEDPEDVILLSIGEEASVPSTSEVMLLIQLLPGFRPEKTPNDMEADCSFTARAEWGLPFGVFLDCIDC